MHSLDRRAVNVCSFLSPFLLTLCLMLCGVGKVSAQPQAPGPSYILSKQMDSVVRRQCSRPNPEGVESTWEVTPDLAYTIDRDLATHAMFPSSYKPIQQPSRYPRQYLGVVIKGRRMIYINASYGITESEGSKVGFIACDDGSASWGALYDPVSRQFSDVHSNLAPPPPEARF